MWVNDNVECTVERKKVVDHFMAWYNKGLTYHQCKLSNSMEFFCSIVNFLDNVH